MGALMQERRPSQPDEFRKIELIAPDAFLSVPTTRKLLDRLAFAGWLEYIGREPPREAPAVAGHLPGESLRWPGKVANRGFRGHDGLGRLDTRQGAVDFPPLPMRYTG